MAYTFRLELEKAHSKLILLNNEKAVAERSWPEARDMGTRLFTAMSELLGDEGIKPEQVEDFVVESDLPDVYTSARIAETIQKVYAFAVEKKG